MTLAEEYVERNKTLKTLETIVTKLCQCKMTVEREGDRDVAIYRPELTADELAITLTSLEVVHRQVTKRTVSDLQKHGIGPIVQA